MKRIKIIIIFSVIIIAAAGGIIAYNIINRFEYNDSGAVGNTTGNLYNQGLVCEYGEYVFFSNPNDNGALYKMNKDGTEFEKIYDDNTSYICIYNDMIYYKKFNGTQNKDKLFSRVLYGIQRLKTNGKGSLMLHNGKIDCMVLCGNYIYYRYYDDETFFSLRKVKIDGKEDILISDEDYEPIAVFNGKIYLTDVTDTHNIMVLDTENDSIRTLAQGNFYMPDVYNGYLYYIDLNNNRRLTRMSMSTRETEVISNDSVINYNLGGKYGVIYYQAENSTDEHKLVRIALNGMGYNTIAQGDYNKIGITEKYTYFYKKIGDESIMYRTPTKGAVDVEKFTPEVVED